MMLLPRLIVVIQSSSFFLIYLQPFDTVDHTILIRRLSTHFGIRGRELDWFVSYLSDRAQYTKVNDTSSNSLYLTQGVPQGSVLGLILYSLYTSPSNIK